MSSAFDTEPSAGHADVVWEKMSRRVAGDSRLVGGQMHYKSHNDMEKVLEAQGMIKQAKKVRVDRQKVSK